MTIKSLADTFWLGEIDIIGYEYTNEKLEEKIYISFCKYINIIFSEGYSGGITFEEAQFAISRVSLLYDEDVIGSCISTLIESGIIIEHEGLLYSRQEYKDTFFRKDRYEYQKRRKISAKERISIMRKSNYICWYCGAALNRENDCLDHIVPLSKGGEDSLDNLVPACRYCNTLKKSMYIEDFRQYMAKKNESDVHVFWFEKNSYEINNNTNRSA